MKGRILFVGRYPLHFHYYRSILRALLRRGFRVLLLLSAAKGDPEENDFRPIETFAKANPGFEFRFAKKSWGLKKRILALTRELINYRNYLTISGRSEVYMVRVYKSLPAWVQKLLAFPGATLLLKSRLADWLLKSVERLAPIDKVIADDFRDIAPMLVMAAPVNMKQKKDIPDLEYLKAAKRLGLPTILPVISWDNLTNKGQIHVLPDRVFVWNKLQYSEARKYHHIPEATLRITGAPLFDQWFDDLRPSMTREEFLKMHHIPQGKYILYLGSSPNITGGTELNVVKLLRSALDGSGDSKLRDLHIVVRPHPSNSEGLEREEVAGVSIVPRGGKIPSSREALQLFFDSLYFAEAVVGINCSAMIESLIAGKPVIAYMAPEYRATQKDTEHFRWFVSLGVVDTPGIPEEFTTNMGDILAGKDKWREARGNLIKNYIRPRGLDRSAGEAAADEIEALIEERVVSRQ